MCLLIEISPVYMDVSFHCFTFVVSCNPSLHQRGASSGVLRVSRRNDLALAAVRNRNQILLIPRYDAISPDFERQRSSAQSGQSDFHKYSPSGTAMLTCTQQHHLLKPNNMSAVSYRLLDLETVAMHREASCSNTLHAGSCGSACRAQPATTIGNMTFTNLFIFEEDRLDILTAWECLDLCLPQHSATEHVTEAYITPQVHCNHSQLGPPTTPPSAGRARLGPLATGGLIGAATGGPTSPPPAGRARLGPPATGGLIEAATGEVLCIPSGAVSDADLDCWIALPDDGSAACAVGASPAQTALGRASSAAC